MIPRASKSSTSVPYGRPGYRDKQFRARVTGIDLELSLVKKARRYARQNGIDSACEFKQVEVGPLPFTNESFDIVTSAGAMTQTREKQAMFLEIKRVLRPGGWFSAYDWMKILGEYSKDMRYWFKTEGLTYEMVTLEEQVELLESAGFRTRSLMLVTGIRRRQNE